MVTVALYLSVLSIDQMDNESHRKTGRHHKRLAVLNGSLFHRVRGSASLIPRKHVRRLALKSYSGDIGHWDKRATLPMIFIASGGFRCT